MLFLEFFLIRLTTSQFVTKKVIGTQAGSKISSDQM